MKRCLLLLFCLLLLVCFAGRSYGFSLMGERTTLFEKRHYTSNTGDAAFDYYLLKPLNYDPGKSYPLVLTLHGASSHSIGAYVLSTQSMQETYPAFVLVPHIPMIVGWQMDIYKDEAPEPLTHVARIIEQLQSEFSLDKTRLYITGYSMGGYGTFAMIGLYPDLFVAAAPLCGGGDVKNAHLMVKTPFFVAHGAIDPGIPVERSRVMVQAIKQAGGNVTYAEYPDVGHDVWNRLYTNPKFWAWMFAQKKK